MAAPKNAGNWLFLAWTVALAATLGALFIGEVMGQMPCVLCWYQRIAMFPLSLLLGVAALRGDLAVWVYALPIALIGLVISGYHTLLYADMIPAPIVPCQATGPSCSGDGMTVAGVPIPYLSVLAFGAISVLLMPLTRKSA